MSVSDSTVKKHDNKLWRHRTFALWCLWEQSWLYLQRKVTCFYSILKCMIFLLQSTHTGLIYSPLPQLAVRVPSIDSYYYTSYKHGIAAPQHACLPGLEKFFVTDSMQERRLCNKTNKSRHIIDSQILSVVWQKTVKTKETCVSTVPPALTCVLFAG